MDEPPKRTRAEMIAQLVVIFVLMAILVGAIFFLHDYVTSHSSAPATSRVLHSALAPRSTAPR
jgi:flagellar basal body-associated protein FliL